MPRVYVGVGSNIDREANIRAGIAALRSRFGRLRVSPVYRSRAVGFSGDDFYNLVVAFDTVELPEAVAGTLHDIELRFGRERQAERFSSRTLDLDLLLYGDFVGNVGDQTLPRDDVDRYGFVLRPLADIAGDCKHPVSGRSFTELWSAFSDAEGSALQPVTLAGLDDPPPPAGGHGGKH